MSTKTQLNIFKEPLDECSCKPMTGYFRNGCCDTSELDKGSHTVCAIITESFLEFSKLRGNDLSTPVKEFDFPGLKPGDKWCLCANRWLEAFESNCAPNILAKSTNLEALKIIPFEKIKRYAIDIS